MAQASTIPFRAAAARHRFSQVYVRPIVIGAPIDIDLNRVGYLCALKCHIYGTVTVGTAGTVTDGDAGNNYFPNISISSPQGDSPHAYSLRSLIDYNYRLHPGTSPLSDPSYAGINFGSATMQNVDMRFEIPVTLNDNLNFDTGMLMRQVSNNNFKLHLQAFTQADLIGAGSAAISASNLTIEIEELFYEAVNPAVVTPPDFHTIVRLREYAWNNLSTGDNFETYQPGPTLLDAIMRVQGNSVGDTANVNRIRLYANKQTNIDDRTGADIRSENYQHLGKAMRAGVFHLDYFDDVGIVNQSKGRDFLNTNDAAQLDFVFNLASGFNTTNSKIVALFRELVTLGV